MASEPIQGNSHAGAKMSKFKVGLMAIGLSLGLAGGLAMAPRPAAAASFNCRQARAPDERAICADSLLDNRDVEMTVRYDMILRLVAMGQRGDLQDQQRAWLARRGACRGNRACLLRAYDSRIGQLKAVFDQIASRGPF